MFNERRESILRRIDNLLVREDVEFFREIDRDDEEYNLETIIESNNDNRLKG